MKKFISLSVSFLAMIGFAMAETDSKALAVIQDIQQGRDNNNQIDVLRVKGAATIGGTITSTGAMTAGGKAVVTGSSTTALRVESGTKAATGSSVTNTFASAFTVAPVVIYKYDVAGIAATNPITITASNFIVAAAQTNLSYIAVGQ